MKNPGLPMPFNQGAFLRKPLICSFRAGVLPGASILGRFSSQGRRRKPFELLVPFTAFATRGTRTPYLLLRRQLLYPGELVSPLAPQTGALYLYHKRKSCERLFSFPARVFSPGRRHGIPPPGRDSPAGPETHPRRSPESPDPGLSCFSPNRTRDRW